MEEKEGELERRERGSFGIPSGLKFFKDEMVNGI